jgi:ABC transport system ATP-binding/permease protein
MALEPPLSAEAAPALQVRTQGASRSLPAGRSYAIGRDPQADLVLADTRVSWRHALLRFDGSCWLLEDGGSTNGTFFGAERVQRFPISGPCAIRLGHPDDGPVIEFSVAVAPGGPQPPTASPGPAGFQAQPGAQPGGAAGAQRGHPGRPAQPAQPGYPGAAVAQPGYASPGPAQPGYPGPAGPQPGYAAPAAAHPGQPGAAGYAGDGGQPAYFQPDGAQPVAFAGQPGQAAPAHPAVPRQRLEDRGRPPGAPRSSLERMPSAVMRLPETLLRIGRAADNQVVISDLSVSRYHAELRRDPAGGYVIIDLNSHNGTYVNGQRVGAAPVTDLDIIGIGPATYRLFGSELQEFLDTGDISFMAQDLSVVLPGGKVLMDQMTFPLGGRCLLGVIGPSGAGKSTLLGALTGIRPATMGSVLYDGRDLYSHYAELRHRIGLVPQEDILHTQLTARSALQYAAELRFPQDTSKAERNQRIDEVLAELSLTVHADTKTAALSGGQKKRVNVALELLTRPSLLFLDEPTSGLDPGLDKSVMEQMTDLAHGGRTVIVVTHSVDNLDLCDRLLVLVAGGKIGYFGAPRDGLKYFGKSRWAEVFQGFEDQPGRDWATEFCNSPFYQQYVAGELMAGAAQVQQNAAVPPPPAPRSSSWFSQLSTLVRRYTAVIASDKVYLGFLAGAPLALAVIVRLLNPKMGLTGPGNGQAISLLLILCLGSCFTGALNSVREIVKELPIYTRERAAGLSAGAYLWSKLIVLGVISALQAVILVVAGLAGVKMPASGSFLHSLPLVELILAMALVSIASMALGLFISSMVNTSEKTFPLLFLSVMVQVIMTGGAVPVTTNGLKQIAWFFPARWGFGAAASTTDLSVISAPPGHPPVNPDPVWAHDAKTWLTDMGLQLVLFFAFAFLTWLRLRKLGPGRRK